VPAVPVEKEPTLVALQQVAAQQVAAQQVAAQQVAAQQVAAIRQRILHQRILHQRILRPNHVYQVSVWEHQDITQRTVIITAMMEQPDANVQIHTNAQLGQLS
jgi:hypothetical protein